MMNGVVHVTDVMNLPVDQDVARFDPQLSMPYFTDSSGKEAEPITIDSTLWQTPVDTLHPIDIAQPQGYQAEEINQEIDDSNNAEFLSYEILKRTPQTTRTASESSVPSLFSGSSGSWESPPTKHARPKITKKQGSKMERNKQKTSKLAAADVAGDEDDAKRNKYLERNRVAASKCRQKKKAWINDLEAQKSELEQKRSNLQHENKSLINEITQLKNQLVQHAGCSDPRINSWIETEARRFVQKTTDSE